ncbi:hypothetical protein B0A52_03021 [Exophiala mesophila]|uniref:Phytanoyl-CoA dioxygenase n=1 Tax=Exophiala mesophila TaxID=212818 RepID=A0A438NC68_EXOME|nr:hypothetical protein B0A52_03021 [Exophiala mesophila]
MSTTLVETETKQAKPKLVSPPVPVLDASTTSVEEILKGMNVAGGVVIKNAISLDKVQQIESDVRPWLAKDQAWKGDGFFPKETRRAYGLASKSKTYIEEMVKHKLYQGVCQAVLTTKISSWIGDKQEHSVSKPQLNTSIIFSIGPGAKAQALHRDDMIHHNYPLTAITPAEHTFRREAGIGFFIAGKTATKANGATRFIPGSHLWSSETPPDEDLAYYAELEPGDGFIMYSSCYHAGSANTTTDQERLLYCCFSTRGYLRQEENQYLAHDPKVLREMYDDETLEV